MWYDSGSVAVTNGSTTVTGTGTNFISGAQVGEAFLAPDDKLYEIASITSASVLVLADAYLGSTQSGQGYKIVPTQSLVADLASDVTDLIADYADVKDKAGAGKFNDGSVTSPAITFEQDQNNGLYRIGSDNYGLSAGGTKQIDISTTDVELNYSGSKKLATTSTGVDVTGKVTADGLTVGGTGTGDANVQLKRSSDGLTVGNITVDSADSALNYSTAYSFADFYTESSKRGLTINNGDVSFYEDTGTTAKFVWDASAESLQLFNTAGTSFNNGGLQIGSGAAVGDYTMTAGFNTAGEYGYLQSTKIGSYFSDIALNPNGGNVGIGTASPTNKLSVSTSTYANSYVPIQDLKYNTFDVMKLGYTAVTGSIRTGTIDTGNYGFAVNTGDGSERMRIDSAGNVGIGTASPKSELHVTKNQQADTSIEVSNVGSPTASTTSSFIVSEAEGVPKGWLRRYRDGSARTSIGYDGNFTIESTAGAERARIDSSGNLLVGKTSTGSGVDGFSYVASATATQLSRTSGDALSVNRNGTDGDIAVFRKDGSTVGSIGTYSGRLYIGEGDVGLRFADDFDQIAPFNPSTGVIRDNAINLGAGAARFKDLYLSGGVITSSDYRLKEDVKPMQSYADTIKQMNLVNFAWKDSGKREDGFIAHELQALVPSAVRGDKDAIDEDGNEQYQGVDPLKLIPVLTKALQEALERIETLENK